MPELRTDIDDFMRRDLGFLGKTKPVLTTGTAGPAVIVIHEVYGFTPTLARFCRWIRDGGFVSMRLYCSAARTRATRSGSCQAVCSACASRENSICLRPARAARSSHGSENWPGSLIAN